MMEWRKPVGALLIALAVVLFLQGAGVRILATVGIDTTPPRIVPPRIFGTDASNPPTSCGCETYLPIGFYDNGSGLSYGYIRLEQWPIGTTNYSGSPLAVLYTWENSNMGGVSSYGFSLSTPIWLGSSYDYRVIVIAKDLAGNETTYYGYLRVLKVPSGTLWINGVPITSDAFVWFNTRTLNFEIRNLENEFVVVPTVEIIQKQTDYRTKLRIPYPNSVSWTAPSDGIYTIECRLEYYYENSGYYVTIASIQLGANVSTPPSPSPQPSGSPPLLLLSVPLLAGGIYLLSGKKFR